MSDYGYWLWLAVDYESCDPCTAWSGSWFSSYCGYWWQKHTKYVRIGDAGQIAPGDSGGTFGGKDDPVPPPSAQDLVNAIKAATQPGAQTNIPSYGLLDSLTK
jgi:hypothetical protein